MEDYLKVRRVRNGWILEDVKAGETSEAYAFSGELIDGGGGEKGEAMAFRDLLIIIKDLIGTTDSRYSQYRVSVGIVAGDKFEG